MKKKILILFNNNELLDIHNIVNFDDLDYSICKKISDVSEYSEWIDRLNPDIVFCDDVFYQYLKVTHPKQYKLIFTDDDIVSNNYTYSIKSPLTAEKIISRIYTIDFQIRKQRDKLEHRMNVTEFLLPLILDYKGEYSERCIIQRVDASYLLNDYDDPCFCIFSFEIHNNKQILDIDNFYLEEIDNILNKYINAYNYIIGNRIISFFVLSHAGRIKNINKAVEELKNNFAERQIEINVGRSSIFNKLSLTHTSFLEALKASKNQNNTNKKIKLMMPADKLFKDFEKNIIHILKNESEEDLVNVIEYCFTIPNEEEKHRLFNLICETVYKTTLSITGSNQFIHFISNELFIQNKDIFVDEELRKNEFIRLMLNARKCINENKRNDTENLCDQVLDIIHQEYQDENLSLADISKRLNVSTNYLCALIKKVLGKNYTTLVNEIRMEAAKSLIQNSNLKINEISLRCGYSDQHYFSTCFKKYFGISPNKAKNKQIKIPVEK